MEDYGGKEIRAIDSDNESPYYIIDDKTIIRHRWRNSCQGGIQAHKPAR